MRKVQPGHGGTSLPSTMLMVRELHFLLQLVVIDFHLPVFGHLSLVLVVIRLVVIDGSFVEVVLKYLQCSIRRETCPVLLERRHVIPDFSRDGK